jgi:heparan-alpha-glucosaminide N-acetyltransferase
MTQGVRFHSIDIMKGLLIFMMLFFNNIFLPALPPWLSDFGPENSYWGYTGLVFPAFLFMAGMTVPFAISKKINNGDSPVDISRQIFGRFVILLTIGVLMVNTYRVDAQLTGFSKNLWSLLMFIAIFLVWIRYPEKENNFFTVSGLRLTGLAIFVFLIFKFRSGSPENNGSLIPGWWDIPGLLGWGYLVTAFTFLAIRNSIGITIIIWLVFLSLNILTKLNLLEAIGPVRPYLGVLTDGHIPFIMLSGHLTALILKRFSANEFRKIILIIAPAGFLLLIAGLVLNKTFSLAGLSGNPALALITCGITMNIFIFIFWLADVRKNDRLFAFIKPAGENALTAYIAPNIIYHLICITGLPILFYLGSANIFINMAGSAIWAIIMVGITSVLIRINIRLKIPL